jgi:hypothetical protein
MMMMRINFFRGRGRLKKTRAKILPHGIYEDIRSKLKLSVKLPINKTTYNSWRMNFFALGCDDPPSFLAL